MASAKKEAKKYLGSVDDYINLSGLNNERTLQNDIYNTNMKSFENTYNDLLNTLASNRKTAKVDFTKGRNTVSENAYMQNRSDLNNLASRGLNGGLAQLNKMGNRIETGRQFSDLANTYYNTMDAINANEKSYTNQYNTNLESAKNTLNLALADIDAREKSGRNAYKTAVAQLAEQIQSRKDAAAAAAAQLKLQKQQLKAEQNARLKQFNAKLSEIAGTGKNLTKESYDNAVAQYRAVMGGSVADAVNYLTSKGIGYGVSQPGVIGPTQPWVAPKTTTSKSSSKKTTTKKVTHRGRGGGF